MGSKQEIRKRKFYHASPRRFRHGDILSGGHAGGYGYACHDVCLTTSSVAHCTIMDKAVEGDWFVYEVEPLENIQNQRPNGNHELRVSSARVLRCVGNARALSRGKKVGSVVKGRREKVINSLSRLASSYGRDRKKHVNTEACLRSYIRGILRENVNERERLEMQLADISRQCRRLQDELARRPYDEVGEEQLQDLRIQKAALADTLRQLPREPVSPLSPDDEMMAVYGGSDNYKGGRGLGS